MLKPSERRDLELIAADERAADEWFADGLRYGRPHRPREYRRRRRLCALVALAALAALAVGGSLVARGDVAGVVLIWLLIPAGWAVRRLRRLADPH